ncbi:hypothetical protein [Nocardiopsis coralliicola]
MGRTRLLGGLLAAVVLLQFGYPVTEYGRFWFGLYLLAYAALVAIGTALVRESRVRVGGLAVAAGTLLGFGAWTAADPGSDPARIGLFGAMAEGAFGGWRSSRAVSWCTHRKADEGVRAGFPCRLRRTQRGACQGDAQQDSHPANAP